MKVKYLNFLAKKVGNSIYLYYLRTNKFDYLLLFLYILITTTTRHKCSVSPGGVKSYSVGCIKFSF